MHVEGIYEHKRIGSGWKFGGSPVYTTGFNRVACGETVALVAKRACIVHNIMLAKRAGWWPDAMYMAS